jgi:hypothetical protein
LAKRRREQQEILPEGGETSSLLFFPWSGLFGWQGRQNIESTRMIMFCPILFDSSTDPSRFGPTLGPEIAMQARIFAKACERKQQGFICSPSMSPLGVNVRQPHTNGGAEQASGPQETPKAREMAVTGKLRRARRI